MSEPLKAFHDRTIGHSYGNWNGDYIGECVSGVQQLLIHVYSLACGPWGNAVDYRFGGSAGSHLALAGFKWHANNISGIKDGDILVWGDDKGNWTGPYGHIAYWYKGQIVNQNYAGNRSFGADPFFAAGFMGYWHKPVPAPKPSTKKSSLKWATVTGAGGAYVRSQAKIGKNLAGSRWIAKGEKFHYTAVVKGQAVNKNTSWLKTSKGNFVWAGNVKR